MRSIAIDYTGMQNLTTSVGRNSLIGLMKSMAMDKVSIDVMTNKGATFYCTLSFLWDRKKAITEEWMRKFVVSKLPSLKDREYMGRFSNQRII